MKESKGIMTWEIVVHIKRREQNGSLMYRLLCSLGSW
jgi:hypothetical protein